MHSMCVNQLRRDKIMDVGRKGLKRGLIAQEAMDEYKK